MNFGHRLLYEPNAPNKQTTNKLQTTTKSGRCLKMDQQWVEKWAECGPLGV